MARARKIERSVISEDPNGLTSNLQVLNEIVGKAVEIVDHNDHAH